MAKVRPFNPSSLSNVAVSAIRPPMGVGALVWRYVVFVPLSEQKLGDENVERIADAEDIDDLLARLSKDFSGVTILLPVLGHGLRDAADPNSLEVNRNLPFVVYAKPLAASDRYFDRLQQELREAFGQGVILVERQEAFLFASGQEEHSTTLKGPRSKKR
jgi:hypothetical protein